MLFPRIAGVVLALITLSSVVADSTNRAERVMPIRHVDPAGAAKLLREASPVILDIRTPEEFKAGHLAGAKNIDFQAADFEKRLAELDRGRAYLVHCQSGRRSTRALEIFTRLGFKSVIHLDGGYRAWTQAGNPVEK